MDNRDFLFVFAFAKHHNVAKFGKPQLHLLPFRFDEPWDFETESADYVHRDRLGKQHLRRFWENLGQGHDLFNRNPAPLEFTFGPLVLREGDKSRDVRRVKRALKGLGLYDGTPGTFFGRDLKHAVQRLQEDNDLEPNGVVDAATQTAIGLDWKTRYVFE